MHRRTVRQALASAVPPSRKTATRVAPRLESFKAAIDAMLRGDLEAPKKQRHTARRVLARLVDEHGAQGLSYSTVRDYVRKRRPQIDGSHSVSRAFFISGTAGVSPAATVSAVDVLIGPPTTKYPSPASSKSQADLDQSATTDREEGSNCHDEGECVS